MTSEQASEVERKYDVDPSRRVPDLHRLPGVARVAQPVELDQIATYYDTQDLRLLSAAVTLRRRTGGVDDGWHLKLPASGDRRDEVHVPLGEADEEVPASLLARVRVRVRDHPVAPVAVLTTRRRIHRLLDDHGAVLAELCDDHVTAETASGSPAVEEWREWELEVVDGPEEILEVAEPVLAEAGARPATVASKLSRVLAGRLDVPTSRPVNSRVEKDASTAGVLSHYLATHLARLLDQDQRLRSGDQEGVHKLRVAARRLRSALATYTPVLQPGATDSLRAELKWLGGVLAEARDAQVLRERLGTLVDGQPDELVIGPVRSRVDDELREMFRSGRAAADEAFDDERYFRMLDRLEAFVDQPPMAGNDPAPARKVVPGLLRRDLRRVHKRSRAFAQADSAHQRDVALHEIRKSAKRLRYAAESTRPVLGKQAKRLAAQAEAVQEMLGEHQDTVVSRRVLRGMGVRASLAGENGFTFGRLHALEECRASELEREWSEVLADLPEDLPGS
jgi:CHAD domain-containing protein